MRRPNRQRRRVRPPLKPALVSGTVERVVPGGLALLRDDAGILFCRGALPGEEVVVAVTRKKGGVRHGQLHAVTTPSPSRVSPDCPHHPRCGGCDFLDFDNSASSEAKLAMVKDGLSRIGRLDDTQLLAVEALLEAPLHAGSRNRCTLRATKEGQLGFFARESHDLIAVGRCPALVQPLQNALAACQKVRWPASAELALCADPAGNVSAALKNAPTALAQSLSRLPELTGVIATTAQGQSRSFGAPVLHGVIASHAPGGPYRSDAATFSQATAFGGERIASLVAEMAQERTSVVELFAGAGHITLSLAPRSKRLLAVEGEPRAFHWLVDNAASSPFAERIQCKQLDIWGGGDLSALPAAPDLLVVDPPRSGIAGWEAILEHLQPRDLIMVSCDIATGARDLRVALERGYVLERLVPIDAFPRTSHVEWVALLRGTAPISPQDTDVTGEAANVQCPYCAQALELWIEASTEGSFVTDCEVCCNPWQVVVQREGGRLLSVVVTRAQ